MSFDKSKYTPFEKGTPSVKGTRVVGLVSDSWHEAGCFGTIEEDNSSLPSITWDNGKESAEYLHRLAPLDTYTSQSLPSQIDSIGWCESKQGGVQVYKKAPTTNESIHFIKTKRIEINLVD